MVGWALASGVGVTGFCIWRAWRKDAAIRSGEVMDVRDLLPDGQGDCLVRVLAERLYRVELQVELTLTSRDDARLPCRLVVTRTSDEGDLDVVYDGTSSLLDLQGELASSRALADGRRRLSGSLPLLEFRADALVRLRFDAEAPLVEQGAAGEVARIDKASLVVKEGVRPLVGVGGGLARLTLEDPRRL